MADPENQCVTPRGLYAQMACVWEATARKPGNVHRYADFEDVSYVDFLTSAAAIAPVLDEAHKHPVGLTILEAINKTTLVTRTNTNLGIVLLLAPLAAISDHEPLKLGVERVLQGLTVEDSKWVYEAIRLAQPGGLGKVKHQDVRDEPTLPLREIMSLAADRDLIARQYHLGFGPVIEAVDTVLRKEIERGESLEQAVVGLHLWFLSTAPDTLIERKCGQARAREVQERAAEILNERDVFLKKRKFAEFDTYLRADGNRRNPGATADLVAASLYVGLREDIIQLLSCWESR